LLDPDHAAVEVNILPPEGDQFTAPHSGSECGDGDGIECPTP
jgi:hypothetical protein